MKKVDIKEENNKRNKEEEKIWHKQQETILKKWSEIGSSYRFMHDRSFTKYNTQNFRFALPVIVAGIRVATAMVIGITTIAAFIGAGGLGDFITQGLSMNSTPLILLGAVPTALLA